MYYNLPIDNLPSSLTHLELGYVFNRPICKFPIKLQYLTFGAGYAQPINNLPPDLVSIEFPSYCAFNESIDVLPKNLLFLKLGSNFDKEITKLPDKITELHLNLNYKYFSTLPEGDYILYIRAFGSVINYKPIDNLPIWIKTIKIPTEYAGLIQKIPFGCKVYDLDWKLVN
jgi:hypothetical protein